MINKSKLITLLLTLILLTILEHPKTAKTLKILLPMRLPREILSSPLIIATNDVINSGNEVPKATTVTPIINSETPKRDASITAFETNNSDPQARPAAPTKKYRIINVAGHFDPEGSATLVPRFSALLDISR